MTRTTHREVRRGEPGCQREPWLSVIIPTLNEAGVIGDALGALTRSAGEEAIEIIVVDGGSVDGTGKIAGRIGAVVVGCETGRGPQMNAGAAVAQGDALLFLHADTFLPAEFYVHIRETLGRTGVVSGAFEFGIDGVGWVFRLIEWCVNRRSRWLSLPYGDQGIFMRVDTFKALGRYRELAAMEDYDLIRRAGKLGRVLIARARVRTSARRWRRQGVVCATLTNQVCIIGYHLGVSPRRLAAWRDDRCARQTAKNGQIHDAGSDHGSGRADRTGAAGTAGT